jgi:hypothetical protein
METGAEMAVAAVEVVAMQTQMAEPEPQIRVTLAVTVLLA